MNRTTRSKKALLQENDDLRSRLEEAEQALGAIRNGEVDALVVYGEHEEQVYTLQGADHSYRILVETMNEGTATLSEEGLVLYANCRLATLLRTSLEKIQGTEFVYFVSPNHRQTFEKLWEGSQKGSRGEIVLECFDRTQVPVQLSLSRMVNEAITSICLVVTDLTDQKEAEAFLRMQTEELSSAYQNLQSTHEELEIAEEELRVQNEELAVAFEKEKSMRKQLIQSEKYAALARLVASIAHEINNPIQTIQNCLYLIKMDLPEGQPRATMEMAVSEASRMRNLVQQLRETYRPDKDIQPIDINLMDVLESCHSLITPQLQQNHIIYRFQAEQQRVPLHGSPDQLKQVFLNICLNAVDAMGSNGGELCITVSPSAEEKKVCIAFQDSGPGISPENLGKIFEPFFTTKPKGTGLGLAISNEIVKNHGGEIALESELGRGTTFKVFLPIR